MQQADERSGLIEYRSPLSVKETADRLEDVLAETGMTVIARVNHALAAQKADMDLRPTEVIIFGNPLGGTPFMQLAQSSAIDLPQKAVVWQDADEQVHLAFNAPRYLAERHGITGADALIEKTAGALDAIAKKTLG